VPSGDLVSVLVSPFVWALQFFGYQRLANERDSRNRTTHGGFPGQSGTNPRRYSSIIGQYSAVLPSTELLAISLASTRAAAANRPCFEHLPRQFVHELGGAGTIRAGPVGVRPDDWGTSTRSCDCPLDCSPGSGLFHCRSMSWKRMLPYVTGSDDEELLLRNEYLVTENRLPPHQIRGRLRLGDGSTIVSSSVCRAA